jgi:DNA-directed RNA polymerase subunit RPC12/RpoP
MNYTNIYFVVIMLSVIFCMIKNSDDDKNAIGHIMIRQHNSMYKGNKTHAYNCSICGNAASSADRDPRGVLVCPSCPHLLVCADCGDKVPYTTKRERKQF